MSTSINNIRIACLSDLHGNLPKPVDCDLALIAGDVCPELTHNQQLGWLQGSFLPWLKNFRRVCWIAGNHDYVCSDPSLLRPVLMGHYGHGTYLEDSGAQPFHPFLSHNSDYEKFSGLVVWGTPWSLPYGDYAFMAGEGFIARKYEGMSYCDILISHGPPYGIGDIGHQNKHAGSHALLHIIETRKPKLCVFGHIHGGHGVYHHGNTLLINASVCDDEYRLVNDPIIVNFKDGVLTV